MVTVPSSGTNIRLLSGVPFTNDYKNTRWFDTQSQQLNYFSTKPNVHFMDNANFQRVDGYNFVKVNESIDSLWNVNYLMFQNQQYNNKWFYAFVTKLEYIQKNITYVHFEIDVLQTWKFDVDFKPSFIAREHCKLWNDDGTPVINTIDEGLNYGSDYDTTSVYQWQPTGGYKWMVIVAKTPIHFEGKEAITPTVIGTPQPLSVYVLPFKDDDTVPQLYLEKNKKGVLLSKPTEVLNHLYVDQEAVNNIVSLYITDYIGLPVTFSSNTLTFPDNGNELEPAQIADGDKYFNCLYITKVLKFGTEAYGLGNKYSGYNTVKESKLLMSPYTQLIFDDFKGNRVTFKNEYINGKELELMVKGSLGTSNKTSYGIPNYNFDANGIKTQLSDEYALINNEANDLPIISDMLSAYLQGNKNSIAAQKSMILFNAEMSVAKGVMDTGAGIAYKNPFAIGDGLLNVVEGAGRGALEMQALNAKQKDIANTPPQMAKMGGNTSYNLGNGYDGVYVIKKQIKPEYVKKLTHYFNMYGYKLNEVKVPNFHTRKYWNYVQTVSCTILGNLANNDLRRIKDIFDAGITLWHSDNVGDYSQNNEVI